MADAQQIDQNESFLTRPPKVRPSIALLLGVVCIPLGIMIKGAIGGALVGGGIGAIMMAAWDAFRLRIFGKRRAKSTH